MKFIFLLCSIIGIFVLSACASVTSNVRSDSGVSISNYTFSGAKNTFKVAQRPKNILVCGNNAADTLIAFGLSDSINTVVLNNASELDNYRKRLPKSKVYPAAITQEAALALKPDFIFAQRRYFDDKVMGDTTFWISSGIPAYIQDASGPIPSLGNFPSCTVESEKNFINNVGKIFQIDVVAQEYIKNIDVELETASGVGKKVLVVEFLNDTIEVFGKRLLSGDIVTKLGGEIIDFSYPFVSLEDIMTVDADVIFVVHHGGTTEAEVALSKMKQEIFAKIPAVKNNKIYALPYNKIVATGVHTIDTIRLIKNGLEK